MTHGVRTVIYPVKDLPAAKKLYTKLLGKEPYFDQPYYVGYQVGEQEIGLDPNGHKEGMTGPVAYFAVSDIRKNVAALVEQGATILSDIHDVGEGKLIATVTVSDGNTIGFIQES